MQVGCYTLDLYCDNSSMAGVNTCKAPYNRNIIQATGETYSKCVKAAKLDGWQVSKKKGDYCPWCTKVKILAIGNAEKTERNAEILQQRDSGMTFVEISKYHGLSESRIREIVSRGRRKKEHGIYWNSNQRQR